MKQNEFPEDITYSDRTIGTSGSQNSRRKADTYRLKEDTELEVFLFSRKGALQKLALPSPPKGRFSFSPDLPIVLDASGDVWKMKSLEGRKIFSDGGIKTDSISLLPHCLIPFRFGNDQYMLYAEETDKDSRLYHNYIVLDGTVIRIGRSEDNDIVYPDPLVSRHHASLTFDGKEWHVIDEDSANGVFVNGYMISQAALKIGDEICIMGLRIIAGSGFLSINDGNDRIRISPEKMMKAENGIEVISRICQDGNRESKPMFSRFPRKRIPLEERDIRIAQPPYQIGEDKIPLLMRMGGSMVMSGTSVLTGNVSMLASSLLMPLLSQQYTKEEREEYEKNRKSKYREYLDKKWQEMLDEKAEEERILNANYPELKEVLSYARTKTKLWERKKSDDDFLTLRVGTGSMPMKAKVISPEEEFQLEEDVLKEELSEMTEKEILLEEVPVLQDLISDYVWGIRGQRASSLQLVRNMILRLTLLYSYDEVKLVFLINDKELQQFEFIRFLPHVWDDQKTIRFIASDLSEAYQIGDYLAKSLDEDLNRPRKLPEMMKNHPYYIVFALDKALLDSMEVMKQVISYDSTCGVSVIAVYDDVPKESSVLFQMKGPTEDELHTVIYPNHPERSDEMLQLDVFNPARAENAMREIANTQLKLLSESFALPKTLTFLEMLGAGKIEHLNIRKRWRENNPVTSLAVPVGIQTDGTLFTLDLHQKFQGPHGLVAGTTGSGKSEFLLTYILSLALNFHPDEVAFVLIDYKGGGLAGAFDDPANGIHLPHLVGTITNLDGSAIARSLVSIQSEMKRRQRVFNEAKSANQEGTMDIYTYQKLYRAGKVSDAMPHLFIISDEFAELKQQEPEFLDQLVSIARIGRSLGVHLILATQKPAGVVTDQIVSNTKFRVCLKVQDRSDSMDMLKRPEACEIRETGRFYLQVGNNELFALGQSAWSGAMYEPMDEVVVKQDKSIQAIDHIGSAILEVKPKEVKSSTGNSQLVAIVRTISDLAVEMGIPQRSLWMPPLKERYDVERTGTVPEESKMLKSIRYTYGMADDPENQNQHLLTLDLVRNSHVFVVGEPGTGKTTFVQSLLYSLARDYPPEKVNFYLLDYSSRLLKMFGVLPHCGAVLGEEDENLLNAFFKLIMELIAERKRLFAELEVDGYEAACEVREIPLILIVIDNIAGMAAGKTGQAHMDRLQGYVKGSAAYGIRFIITASYQNELPSRVRQLLPERVVLHMKDKYEYSEALNCRIGYVPSELPGRGLCIYEERPMEMQLFMFQPELGDRERVAVLKRKIGKFKDRYAAHQRARMLQVLSETETYEVFSEQFRNGRMPLGYDLRNGTPKALPMKQFSMLSLYFGNPDSVIPVMNNVLHFAGKEKMEIYFLKRTGDSIASKLKDAGRQEIRFFETADADAAVDLLLQEIMRRNQILSDFCKEKGIDPNKADIHNDVFEYMYSQVTPVLFLIERYADLCEHAKKTEGILKKYSALYVLARRFQIYILSGFYPGENEILSANKLSLCYNKEELIMMFGGFLDGQMLTKIPYDFPDREKPSKFNRCVMKYRGTCYRMMMPCGILEKEELPEDDRPVFA